VGSVGGEGLGASYITMWDREQAIHPSATYYGKTGGRRKNAD